MAKETKGRGLGQTPFTMITKITKTVTQKTDGFYLSKYYWLTFDLKVEMLENRWRRQVDNKKMMT